jgi:hypothetical protein
MLFADKLSFDHPRKTADGYLVARARASRSGIYEYLGSEIDPKGEHVGANDTVRVYRSEDEVFAADSVASFLMKPVTNDHPSQPVTADNWRDYAKGVVGKALRDGDFLAFDIVLMDNATIADVETGKRELSNGYASTIEFTPGSTATGEHFDAIQKNIRGNHVAIVDMGRAGPLCRIGDAATCDKLPGADLIAILTDERTYNPAPEGDKTADARRETSNSGGSQVATKTITFDGLPLEVTDAAEAAITKLLNQAKGLQDKLTAAEGDVARLTTDKTALDAKVATLEQQAKDAKLTPQQLRDAAKSFAAIVDKAKALGIEVKDDMDEPAIRKAAVSARLGDVAKDWTDEQIAVSFDTLAADVGDNRTDALRSTIASRPLVTADGSAVRDMARAAQYN